MNKKTIIRLAALMTAFILLLSACGQGGSGNAAGSVPSSSGGGADSIPGSSGSIGGGSENSSGSTPQAPVSNADASAYTHFNIVTLREPTYGIKTALALVPEGWSASVVSEWGLVSTLYPAAATIVMTSPDGSAKFEIRSSCGFFQMTSGGQPIREGTYYDWYNTILNYRNAHDFNIYMAQMMGYNGQIVATQGASEDAQRELDNAAQQQLNGLVQSGITAYGCEGSAEKTTFLIDQGGVHKIDILSQVIGSHIGYQRIQQILWIVPYTCMFTAYSQQAYEQYKDLFDVVINNSTFTGEFIYVVQRNAAYLNDMIHNYLMERAFTPSSGDVSSWDSEYRDDGSDTFANAWSDVIYERNEYTTEDGKVIKVGTEYDSVYQDGDDIYMGPDGLAPDGWTKLEKREFGQ